MDQTCWRIVSNSLTTIGITGSDHQSILSNVDPKMGFTAIFIISANGLSFIPTIILKGRSKNALNKIKNISDNEINKKYSSSGWVTVPILFFLLDEIYNYTKGIPSTLILDKYSLHEDEYFKNQAKNFNINLIYVPSGMTGQCQPLDVNYNGPVKSIGRKLMIKELIKDPFEKYTLEKSLKILITASKSIKENTIKKCFDKACNIY